MNQFMGTDTYNMAEIRAREEKAVQLKLSLKKVLLDEYKFYC